MEDDLYRERINTKEIPGPNSSTIFVDKFICFCLYLQANSSAITAAAMKRARDLKSEPVCVNVYGAQESIPPGWESIFWAPLKVFKYWLRCQNASRAMVCG
jgi:hypothetical protein